MEVSYLCRGMAMRSLTWKGKMNIIKFSHPYEFTVESQGNSIHLILGHYEHGNYLCIPNLKISCDIFDLHDPWRNIDSLLTTDLTLMDAFVIVNALEAIDKYIVFHY